MKNKWKIGIGILLVVLVMTVSGITLVINDSENAGKATVSESYRTDKEQNTDNHITDDSKEESTEASNNNQEVSAQAVTGEAAGFTDSEVTAQAVSETPVPSPASTDVPTPEPVVYPESEGARKVYLTFDDGTSEQTDRVLDILAQYGVKATFFVTAHGGEENAARYRRIVAEGHSIGLHSVTHNYQQVYASIESYIADVEGIRQFVKDTTGVDSHLYRFPGGSSNSVSNIPMEECIRYLNQNGYRYFDWNIDTSDSVNRNQSVEEFLSRVFGGAIDKYHNSVILMHDSARQDITVAALPQLIEGIQARGLEILPITEATPVCQHRKAESVQ